MTGSTEKTLNWENQLVKLKWSRAAAEAVKNLNFPVTVRAPEHARAREDHSVTTSIQSPAANIRDGVSKEISTTMDKLLNPFIYSKFLT